jgi:hypothetical protein
VRFVSLYPNELKYNTVPDEYKPPDRAKRDNAKKPLHVCEVLFKFIELTRVKNVGFIFNNNKHAICQKLN